MFCLCGGTFSNREGHIQVIISPLARVFLGTIFMLEIVWGLWSNILKALLES
jgi:hypothetical protein